METVVDACLVALESISPGQRIYYGTLWCRTLPSRDNFPRQRLPPWFFGTDFSLARTVPHFPSHQGAWPELPVTALNLHLIKIPSQLNRDSMFPCWYCSATQLAVFFGGWGNLMYTIWWSCEPAVCSSQWKSSAVCSSQWKCFNKVNAQITQ